MNFDYGDTLTRAAQITWKNKVLWFFSALPVLLSIVIFPIFFLPLFIMDESALNNPPAFEEPLYLIVFFGLGLLVSILSIILYAASSSSVLLGVLRADAGQEALPMGELFTDGRKYWWRILGVVLLIGLGVAVIFLVFFACIALFGAVTMGLALVCLTPFLLLQYPVMVVVYGYMEEAQAAVVVDDLGVIPALTRGWDLLKSNFWRIALISLLVYLIIGFLSALVVMPFMIPFFFFPFFFENGQNVNMRTMLMIVGGMNCLILPVMAVVQGVTITFMKATFMLTYLRLTGGTPSSQPKLDEDRPTPMMPDNAQTLISTEPLESKPAPAEPKDSDKTVIAKKPDA